VGRGACYLATASRRLLLTLARFFFQSQDKTLLKISQKNGILEAGVRYCPLYEQSWAATADISAQGASPHARAGQKQRGRCMMQQCAGRCKGWKLILAPVGG